MPSFLREHILPGFSDYSVSIKYQYVRLQVPCSYFAPHRIFRTWNKYPHVQAFSHSRSVLPSPDPWHTPTVLPSPDFFCLCHPVICLSCSPHSFCNICRMCRNLRSHDSLFYIFQIRKGQMLCRCHIAQKCRSCRCCHGSANRRSNMVISGSNIRSQVVPIHKTALPDKWTAALSYLPRSDPEAYVPDLPPSPEHPSPMPAWSVRPDAPAPQSGRRPLHLQDILVCMRHRVKLSHHIPGRYPESHHNIHKMISSPVIHIHANTREPPLDTMFIFRLCCRICSIVLRVMPQCSVTKSTPSCA